VPGIRTRDFSQTVGSTTAITVFAQGVLNDAPLGAALTYMRIYNVSPSNTIWCSRSGVASPNAPGSFPIYAGNYEIWQPPANVPTNPLSIIAVGGVAQVTIEVG
jgi:hypothetical protein